MTRALLTVNFNNFLCENSRASMKHAAERWGAEFWEWTEQFQTEKIPAAPNALKCWAFRRSNYQELMIIDADAIISAQCPNPFDTFTGPELIAVQNGSERFGDLWQIRSCERYEWDRIQRLEPRLAGAIYIEGEYFNTGMLVARRKYHESMFGLAADISLVDLGLGWVDQSIIVASTAKLGIPVRLVEDRWNYIHASMLGPSWMRMSSTEAFIYHFAGEPGRERVLPAVEWQ